MKYSKLVLFTLISLFFINAFVVLHDSGYLNLASATYVSASFKYISIFIYILIATKDKNARDVPKSIRNLFAIWLTWNAFEIIRALFIASNYWDWKFLLLQSLPFSLIILVFHIGKNLMYVKKIVTIILRYVFPFGFLLIPYALVTQPQLYARLMIFASIFILFIPYMKMKWKILIIAVAVTSVLVTPLFRTNLLKVIFSFLFLSVFYFKRVVSDKIIRIIHLFIFILPVLLVTLGALGKFNIFKDISENNEYSFYSGTVGQGRIKNVNADTRTFLYVEVLSTMAKDNSWLIGRSAVGSYTTKYFNYMPTIGQRFGSEVGILNILLYDGLVGVGIYFLLLYTVSFLAICKSNNYLSKMLGLLIASRWLLSFVEEFTKYDLNFYFFWLIIGLVSTTYFRNMSDNQIRTFFRF